MLLTQHVRRATSNKASSFITCRFCGTEVAPLLALRPYLNSRNKNLQPIFRARGVRPA